MEDHQDLSSSGSAWIDDELMHKERAWWHKLAQKLISSGQVPRHVAFIMDGNRRFARKKKMSTVLKGHEKGFEQMAKVLEWCQELGIHEVTLYAFSIENFKRSDDEVNGLMKLAEEKFERLIHQSEKVAEKQIRFRFFGNLPMLSEKLRKLIIQIQKMTKDYSKGQINICMAYTARDEVARAFELIRRGREKGLLREDQIDDWLISRCLDTRGEDPDLLIRTSGEKRLSDFMLYQCSSTHVYFDDVLWPEFGYANLCKAILSYQYYYKTIELGEEENAVHQICNCMHSFVACFCFQIVDFSLVYLTLIAYFCFFMEDLVNKGVGIREQHFIPLLTLVVSITVYPAGFYGLFWDKPVFLAIYGYRLWLIVLFSVGWMGYCIFYQSNVFGFVVAFVWFVTLLIYLWGIFVTSRARDFIENRYTGIEDVDPEMKEKFKELLEQNLAAVEDLEKKQKNKKEEKVRYFCGLR
ncbi:hypothetical protein WR25_14323 [Diploscapter pachys]|uniref:ditrans,polycis-polyprenyl diphosphate synthase [(2E,6E)-farnesyldiphosphate specific] n=1 Tax=Diploscapter pachys TaxID=2018661 RepID=A0A2A2KH95_9BILA|nr:hypothetical protein WR25_14323 [Diploscapter pachys]